MIPTGLRPTCILIHQFTGHQDAIYSLEASGDGKTFFSASGDGMIIRWSLEHPDNGEVIARIESSVYSMAYNPGTDLLAVGKNNDGIHGFHPGSGKPAGSLHTGPVQIFDICFHQGQLLTASGDGMLRVINPVNWTILNEIQVSGKSLRCIATHPDNGPIAVGCSDNRIYRFDPVTLQRLDDWEAHGNSVFSLAYGSEGDVLYSGSRDARIRTWTTGPNGIRSVETAAHLFTVNHIAFRADGKHFLTCSMDKTIKIWSSGMSPQLQRVLDRARHGGHSSSVNRLCRINEDTFASAGDDRCINIWKFKPAESQ